MSITLQQSNSERLSSELVQWWMDEQADWDLQVEGVTSDEGAEDADLWGSMPTVDSKTVARMSPVFEACLGCPLDTKLIRPGGYSSIQDVITHLVPAMCEASVSNGTSQ